MQFNSGKAIYLQIADYICEQVLRKNWQLEDKIPSVREMAVAIEVNPNTVARAYSYLEAKDVIYTRRGIGFFVKSNGYDSALKIKREVFLSEHLPNVFKNLELLDMDFKDLKNLYDNYKVEMKNED